MESTDIVDEAMYRSAFGIEPSRPKLRRAALHRAMALREFEIELYWKRTTYFWTLIAAVFAGYAAVKLRTAPDDAELGAIVSIVGLVFSVAWLAVNRGSKRWQENWENHVDLLEDEFIGPLHKTILGRPTPPSPKPVLVWLRAKTLGRLRAAATEPANFSVARVNQMVSAFVVVLWIGVVLAEFCGHRELVASVLLVGGIATCVAVLKWCRTARGEFRFVVRRRKARVVGRTEATPPAVLSTPSASASVGDVRRA